MPQIQVWINNDDSANVEKLVKRLDAAMAEKKSKNLKAFFIFVSPDAKSLEPKLKSIAAKTGANDVCLATISPSDRSLRAYKINLAPEVRNTVMLYRQKVVTDKFVNLSADAKGLADLGKAIDKLTK